MNKIQNHEELLMKSDKLMLVKFFYIHEYAKNKRYCIQSKKKYLSIVFTSSSSFKFCLPIAVGTPTDRFATDIP
jgi:hypothetical protein